MKPIIFTKQFGKKYVLDPTSNLTENIDFSTSLQTLIDFQQSIGSTIGYYLFQTPSESFAFVLSEDQNLAQKMDTSISNDIFTADLFPIDYSLIDIDSIFQQDKEETTCIHTDNGNFFYFVAKRQDSIDTLRFIESYKKRSYAMQNSWSQRKSKQL